MSTLYLDIHRLESNLIETHNELVRQLEAKYMDHITKLMQQKSMILMDLQKQFIERRRKIKQNVSFRIKNEIYNDQKRETFPSPTTNMVKAESNVNTMNSGNSIRIDTDFDKVEASMNKNGGRHCKNQRVIDVSNVMQNNFETINLDLPNLAYQPMETLPITPSTVKRISDVDAVMDQPQSDESILCKRSKRLKNKKGENW